jgi:hypothetical protein
MITESEFQVMEQKAYTRNKWKYIPTTILNYVTCSNTIFYLRRKTVYSRN